MRQVLHVLLWMLVCTDVLFAQSLKDQFQQLQNDYISSTNAWETQHKDSKTDDESISRYREWPGWTYAPKFIAFAESAGSSREGFEALLEILNMGNNVGEFDRSLFAHYEHAIRLILEKHRDKELRPICSRVRITEQSENLLRTLLAESDSTELRGEACICLGRLLAQKRNLLLSIASPQRRRVGSLDEYAFARMKDNLDQFLANQDIEQLRAEAIRYFELVTTDYSDVPAMRGDENLGVLARREIYELKHLTIGAVAPEIVGSDLDGEPMRLSDHHGKVVLLVFWASWCGPCVGAIPHENQLHARFAGRPFMIVGVNADSTKDAARKIVKENSVGWRSFWDGKEGPITADWNVRGWPTVYVLDQKGTIRFKQLHREELDEPLEKLVRETETSVAK